MRCAVVGGRLGKRFVSAEDAVRRFYIEISGGCEFDTRAGDDFDFSVIGRV